jgi:hypothetical protein
LANTVGKVLVIDEVCSFEEMYHHLTDHYDQAYMLYGRSGNASNVDPYKTAVIDTIVAEVQSTPGEDRCILLLVSIFYYVPNRILTVELVTIGVQGTDGGDVQGK